MFTCLFWPRLEMSARSSKHLLQYSVCFYYRSKRTLILKLIINVRMRYFIAIIPISWYNCTVECFKGVPFRVITSLALHSILSPPGECMKSVTKKRDGLTRSTTAISKSDQPDFVSPVKKHKTSHYKNPLTPQHRRSKINVRPLIKIPLRQTSPCMCNCFYLHF